MEKISRASKLAEMVEAQNLKTTENLPHSPKQRTQKNMPGLNSPPAAPPNNLVMLVSMGENEFLSFISLVNPFSMTAGNDRRRRVWPVGAVSKTTTSKSIRFTNFITYKETKYISTKAMEARE